MLFVSDTIIGKNKVKKKNYLSCMITLLDYTRDSSFSKTMIHEPQMILVISSCGPSNETEEKN